MAAFRTPARAGAWLGVLWLGACSDGTSPASEPAPLHVSAITVSTGATCALTVQNAVYCWGSGDGGIFPGSSSRPLPIQTSVRFTSLSANSSTGSYVCGLDPNGVPYCWGTIRVNGDSSFFLGAVPTPLPGGVQLTAISTGVQHICGVSVARLTYCWGDFGAGRRGDPTVNLDTARANFIPNIVGGGLEFKQVVAGSIGTCGLTTASEAWCWGSNAYGFLGNSTAQVQQQCGTGLPPCALAPVPVAGGHFYDSISGSSDHVCGVSSSAIFCWGLDDHSQIGTTQPPQLCGSVACVLEPTLVSAPAVLFASVSAGGASTCALDSGNLPYCWGDNSLGQIGNSGKPSAVPALVSGRHQFTTMAVAADHACGLLPSGAAFCWGSNSVGQLGTGDATSTSVPVAVAGPASQ
jgi:alpha-tubulin suppressor-like RCC1 family protein